MPCPPGSGCVDGVGGGEEEMELWYIVSYSPSHFTFSIIIP